MVGVCGDRAVLWRAADHHPVDLGPGTATDINGGGLIVGSSAGAAVVWIPGSTTARPLPGGDHTMAAAVNDHGVVIGWRTDVVPTAEAGVRWADTETEPVYLEGLGHRAWATDVNYPGVAVGSAETDSGDTHMVRRDP